MSKVTESIKGQRSMSQKAQRSKFKVMQYHRTWSLYYLVQLFSRFHEKMSKFKVTESRIGQSSRQRKVIVQGHYTTWADFVVKILVVVHPYFHCAAGIVIKDLDDTSWPRVRGYLTEHMTHTGTRRYQDLATAFPHLEGHSEWLFITTDF